MTRRNWLDRALDRLPRPETVDVLILAFCFAVGGVLLGLALHSRFGGC